MLPLWWRRARAWVPKKKKDEQMISMRNAIMDTLEKLGIAMYDLLIKTRRIIRSE